MINTGTKLSPTEPPKFELQDTGVARESVYVPLSQRLADNLSKAAKVLGVDSITLEALRFTDWLTLGDTRTFCEQIIKGRLTGERVLKGVDRPEVQQWVEYLKSDENLSSSASNDQMDFMNFQLRQIIQVGDCIIADESRYFLSGGEYLTQGKIYEITTIHDRDLGDFSVYHKTNFPEPDDKAVTSVHGIKLVYREGVEIWSWWKAWKDAEIQRRGPLLPEEERELDQYEAQERGKIGIAANTAVYGSSLPGKEPQ
jgi:hypothetical protein